MIEITLTRSADERKRYDLEGVGSLRFAGMFSRDTDAETVDGRRWTFHEGGLLGGRREALDASGASVGTYDKQKLLSRSGVLVWHGRAYTVRSSSVWKHRFAMADGEVELVTVEDKGWGKRPVTVRLEEQDVDRGLLLYFIWLVHQWTQEDAAAGAGAGAGA